MGTLTLLQDRASARPGRNERGLCIVADVGEMIVQTLLARKGVLGGINLIRREHLRTEREGELVLLLDRGPADA